MNMDKPDSPRRIRRLGVTMVELIVAVGIVAILIAVAVPSMTDLLERRRVIAAAEEVGSILTYAKGETNATNSLLYVRFDPDPDQTMSCAAVVTTAGLNTCRCYLAANAVCTGTSSRLLRLFQLPLSHVKFTAYASAWAAAPDYIMFEREQMSLQTQGFYVEVVGLRKGYTLRVEVNAAGRVKICSPNGDMTGYAACS